jgi:hypothetical protein
VTHARPPLLLPTLLLALALPALLLLPACTEDEGPERLAQADARYTALVEAGVQGSANDPRVAALIRDYEAIAPDSKAWPQAQKRLAALRALAAPLPPRPLAVPGSSGPGATAADLQRAACARLAEQLGASAPAGRPALERALGECRQKQSRLEADEHPAGEQDGAH